MQDLLVKIAADWLLIAIFLMAMYAFVFIVPRKRWWHWAWRIALAGVLTYLAARVIGHIYQPEGLRPFEKLGVNPGAAYLNNPGFPSDHVLFATFLTISVWFSTRKKNFVITMATLVLIMGAGRVLALVHTPLDVVGGALIAMLSIIYYGLFGKKVVK
ncbi:hypothetical protein CR956_00715 [Candidatus Saccharibacteria bacterium]|nr:MAG: hypothetical protein CR956_00715 [Candidatus Saccharibacteria bacterium]